MANLLHRLLTTLLSAGLATLLGLSVTAHAGTASGGGATVSGTDEDGGAVSFDSDPVTFSLESETAAPLLSGPTEMPALEGDETFFHYSIMSRSNGEDTYTLSSAPGTPDETNNVSAAGTVTFHNDQPPPDDTFTEVTLGGTVASATAGAGTANITVPADDDSADNISNGIANGDQVVIDGMVYQVTNVTETDPAANQITVDPVLTGEVTEGTAIAEIFDFDVHLEAIGTISDPTAPVTTDAHSGEAYITITATSSDGKAESVNLTAQVYAMVTPVSATYVRNTDSTKNPVDPGDGSSVDYESESGALFYSSGKVTASDNDTLEFVIVASTGTATATEITFTAAIPASSNYVPGSTKLNDADPAVAGWNPAIADDAGASALEAGMAACDLVSCILSSGDSTNPLASTIGMGAKAEAKFKVVIASASDPAAFSAPQEPEMVAWTGAPADACWDDSDNTTSGWANGSCMMGVEASEQAYCNTYAALQATGSFDYAEANSILTILLSCE